MMKPVLIIAVTIAACLARPTDFSVHIKGKLLCHEEPLAKSPMDVFSDSEQRFNYEDFMDRYTDDNGEFSIKAWVNIDAFIITPYVVIKHRCWESKEVPQRCFRNIVQPIPAFNVTSNSKTPDEKRIFNFGTIDLQFKHRAEITVNC